MRAITRPMLLLAIALLMVPSGAVGLEGEVAPADLFEDVSPADTFWADIAWLAEAGITKGCNPPANTRFCPEASITRGEMAAFLVRALGLVDDGGRDWFVDDDASVFERGIDRLAASGITRAATRRPTPTTARMSP